MLVRLRQFLGRVLRLGYGLVGALRLGNARGRALRPHDHLYPCVKYDMQVQI